MRCEQSRLALVLQSLALAAYVEHVTVVQQPVEDRGAITVSPSSSPQSGKGEVEMIRMLKSTKDSAVKARTQTVNQMKALVLTAPAELREMLDDLTTSALDTRQ